MIQYTVPKRIEVARFSVASTTKEDAKFRFGCFVPDNGEYKRKNVGGEKRFLYRRESGRVNLIAH